MRAPLATLSGIVCALAAASAAHGDSGACTRADAIQAETEASSLTTWPEIYRSYLRFRQCDDAAIGEGYSNSVAVILSKHWGDTSTLNDMARRDGGFLAFVLRHVDELMSPAQASAIRHNAERKCPVGAGKLCRDIIHRIGELR